VDQYEACAVKPRRLKVASATVVTLDERLGDFRTADILIEDGRIADIRPAIDAADCEVMDAKDLIALPGFVDTHHHTWQSALRHRMGDLDFWSYCRDMLGELGSHYNPDDVYAGTLIGALAALDAGTTTLVDWSQIQNSPDHTDAAIQALRDAGMRAVFGYGWPRAEGTSWVVNSERTHPEDIRRIRMLLPGDDGLVTLAMAARGPEMTTMRVTETDFRLARELGIRTTMHVGIKDLGKRHRAVAKMNDARLLGPDLTLIHLCETSDEELRMMADHGVTASVGPQCEMTMDRLGLLAIGRLLAAGIRPSLSGDTETTGSGDMFTQMRFALAGGRYLVNNGLASDGEPAVTVRNALEFATVAGAEACGMAERIGSLSPGKDADITLIRGTDLNLAPVSDAVGAVVLGAHPGNVDTVIVKGSVVKRHGKLVGQDAARVRRLAEASRDRLLSAAGKAVRP
jgi:5-methylthioadenosine/S-adenosylhomocysteine deaminase